VRPIGGVIGRLQAVQFREQTIPLQDGLVSRQSDPRHPRRRGSAPDLRHCCCGSVPVGGVSNRPARLTGKGHGNRVEIWRIQIVFPGNPDQGETARWPDRYGQICCDSAVHLREGAAKNCPSYFLCDARRKAEKCLESDLRSKPEINADETFYYAAGSTSARARAPKGRLEILVVDQNQ